MFIMGLLKCIFVDSSCVHHFVFGFLGYFSHCSVFFFIDVINVDQPLLVLVDFRFGVLQFAIKTQKFVFVPSDKLGSNFFERDV